MRNPISKAEIVEKVYEKIGLLKNQSVVNVEEVLKLIKATLENGKNLMISGFGNFVLRKF